MMTEPPTPLVEVEQTSAKTFIFKLRYAVIIILAIFVIGLVAGFFIPSRIFDAFMQNMAGNIESEQYSSLGTFWFILTNNFRVCLIALVTAPLLFFEPLIPLVNGAVITAMGAMVVDVTGSMGLFLAATLPHGILELAAILTCSAAALSLGITFDVNIFTNGLKAAWPEMKFQLKVFLAALLAIPLAALIETYITPWIVELI